MILHFKYIILLVCVCVSDVHRLHPSQASVRVLYQAQHHQLEVFECPV